MNLSSTDDLPFKIGACVRVRARVKDPDWEQDLGGWQGRVLSIAQPKRGKPTVMIAWDSVTLRQMSAAAIEMCEQSGLDWSEYGLGVDEIEATACRDTSRDVERAKKEIAKQYRWVYLGDQGKRMQKILAGVDPDDELGLLERWEECLEEQLGFPFDAVIAEYQERGPLHQGDKLKVLSIELADDLYGLIVSVRRGREKFAIPLCDLEVVPKSSPLFQMVKDYAVWFTNR